MLYAHELGNMRLCDQNRYCSRVRQGEANFSVRNSGSVLAVLSDIRLVTNCTISSTVEQSYNAVDGKSKVGKVRRIAAHNSVTPRESIPVSIRVKGCLFSSALDRSLSMSSYMLPTTSLIMETILERMFSSFEISPTTNTCRVSSVLLSDLYFQPDLGTI